MTFRGTFEFTLDAKNRLTVPSRLRAEFSEGVVLAAGLEPCVAVWRPGDYDVWTTAALAPHNPLSREYRQLERHFTGNSLAADLDSAGRIMLPSFLMRYAKLEREVSLVGTGKSLEIWNRETWDAYNAEVTANVADIAAGLGGAE